ncbi:MAG: heparan-alpha-glucosaminide N-acetyltransferase domain-containing protein [Cytophagaceae bacterium]|jgi:predicted acyltransferase|nr:heparan-alpha-glucosaminide N-acetyltransferase domain-containing protein [Cytophagaceae bacterium]
MEKPGRILSVDLLRGITVMAMILVNNPGDYSNTFAVLLHAEWHGCTPTDLVFPFFLFIVGISVSFSLRSYQQQPTKVYGKIIKRSLLLIALGLFLNLFPTFDLSTLRIPGVLQRIGIVFFFSSLAFLHLNSKQRNGLTAILLLGYWVVMCFIPTSISEIGQLDPGKNVAAWVDDLLLHGHMWEYSQTWDPEGILSTIPAIATGLLGLKAGEMLGNTLLSPSEKIISIFVSGISLATAGWLWGMTFPINKSLWTSSYTIYSAGLAFIALGMVYWYFDWRQNRFYTTPILAFGSNAITAYMVSEILVDVCSHLEWAQRSLRQYGYEFIRLGFLPEKINSLLFALCWLSIIYLVVYFMYRKKIFLKV